MKNKIIYFIATGIMTAIFTFSATMYFFNYDYVEGAYINLGFPTWIIYPLAVAKILGLLVIWRRRNNLLKEWAYAGFFFDALLAFIAHYMIGDADWIPSTIALIAIVTSRVYESKAFVKSSIGLNLKTA